MFSSYYTTERAHNGSSITSHGLHPSINQLHCLRYAH